MVPIPCMFTVRGEGKIMSLWVKWGSCPQVFLEFLKHYKMFIRLVRKYVTWEYSLQDLRVG